MVDPIWGHATITVTAEKVELCDEELIAMAMSMRQLAYADDSLTEHYMLLREVCWQQTGVDTAVLGHHMDRLANVVRTD
jgi:hypothetical protein